MRIPFHGPVVDERFPLLEAGVMIPMYDEL